MNESFFDLVIAWFTDPLNWSGPFGIPSRVAEHVVMSAVSLAIAAAIALPAGLYVGHRRRLEFVVVSIGNFGRAIPSFGLLFLFVLWLGVGLDWPPSLRPAVILALVLLGIPPILTNTYVGIQGVGADVVETGRAMGMSEARVLAAVEVPLAAPLLLAGVRTAAVQIVATATLAAVVAGGGLGRFILDGIAARDFPQVFGGALLVAALAFATEIAFAVAQRLLTPRRTSRRRRRGVGEAFRHAGQALRLR